MEQIQTKPIFYNKLMKDIESTGENLKQSFKELSEIAQKRMDAKINNVKFEAIYGLTVSKKQRMRTMKEVKEVRSEMWKESLKKAQGDTKKAYITYKKFCAFN